MDIAQYIKAGNLTEALKAVQQQVRNCPAEAKYRVLLFQLQVILGLWDKARTQLDVLKDLDPDAQFMVQTYQQMLLCEGIRNDVFLAKRAPMVFGEPEPWIALLIEAITREVKGDFENADAMRAEALEQAPVTSGTIDNEPFEWIADADSRIGPILEVVVNGQYYWVPFYRLSAIQITAPEDLRDFVWLPAQFIWANGGEAFGFIPSRYPNSEDTDDSQIKLSRKTVWDEISPKAYKGMGQRILTSNMTDYPLLDIREIKLNPVAEI